VEVEEAGATGSTTFNKVIVAVSVSLVTSCDVPRATVGMPCCCGVGTLTVENVVVGGAVGLVDKPTVVVVDDPGSFAPVTEAEPQAVSPRSTKPNTAPRATPTLRSFPRFDRRRAGRGDPFDSADWHISCPTTPAWGHDLLLQTNLAFVAVCTQIPRFSRSDIREEDHHDERIERRSDESVVAVEAPRFFIVGVDEQQPDSESVTLVSHIDGHTCQEDGEHLRRGSVGSTGTFKLALAKGSYSVLGHVGCGGEANECTGGNVDVKQTTSNQVQVVWPIP